MLPGGDLVVCSPDNGHRDLFFGLPNSYSTLGYALRLRARTLPTRPLVRVEHRVFADGARFFDELAAQCRGDADFVDAVVFCAHEQVVSVGRFTDEAPWRSDYPFENIYYQSLRSRPCNYLNTQDYLWRRDTDWFWAPRRFVWNLQATIDSSRARCGLWGTRYSALSTNPRGVVYLIWGALN